MKLKRVKIIIKTPEQLKVELIEALKGKRKYIQAENEIVFSSPGAFTKILTANRIEILMYLNNHQPNSIYELAKGLNRDFKNVHSDVKKLSEMNLIRLEPSDDNRKGLIPIAIYSGIDLSLAA